MKKLITIRFINIKVFMLLIILILLVFNILSFYYFNRKLNKLSGAVKVDTTENKPTIIEEPGTQTEELIRKIEELEKRNEDMGDRINNLESLPSLMGETLKSCEYLYGAYPKFPESYDNQLKQCQNSYNKLKSSL